MKKKGTLSRGLLYILAVSLLFIQPSMVQAQPQKQTKNLAISLVIDNSGSMEEYDPQVLRKHASEILIDLLSPEDALGVVSFSNEANEVIPLQTIDQNKSMLKEDLNTSFEASGATNYLSALEMATEQLAKAPKESQKLILFLTDGFPEQKSVNGKLPIPEEEYLSQIKEQVQTIGELDISIYPVGFGESNLDILEEMAELTKGEAAMLNSPSEIASSFFKTLSLTKNRNSIEGLDGRTFQEETIVIPFTNYTQQVTVLITTKGEELSVEQNGESIAGLTVETNTNYSIVTINQKQPGEISEVSLSVSSDAETTVLAARDLFYTMDILQPTLNTVRGVSDSVILEVLLNEPLEKGMWVEAHVIKNSVPELNPIRLTESEGKYTALYEEVDTVGNYEVVFNITNADEIIYQTKTSFSVKNIPILKSDVSLNNKVYLIGEEMKVTSYLELQELRVLENKRLEITDYKLILTNEQGDKLSYPMEDDPDKNTGDIVKGDGLYTSQVEWNDIGKFTGMIKVTGVYQGETFSQEHSLGQFKVSNTGIVEIELIEDSLTVEKKGVVRVPISITNSSQSEELLTVSIPEKNGTVVTEEVTLPPNQTVEEEIVVHLKDLKNESIELSFLPKDARIEIVKGANLTIFLSQKSIVKDWLDFLKKNKVSISFFLGALLFVYVVGEFLYKKRVNQPLSSLLEVTYFPLDERVEAKKEMKLKEESSFRVTIGDMALEGEVSLPAVTPDSSNFIIVISREFGKPGGIRMIKGYHSLFYENEITIKVQALYPGYLIHKGKLITCLTLEHDDTFEAGGYQFICKLKSEKIKQSKDLLEGKET